MDNSDIDSTKSKERLTYRRAVLKTWLSKKRLDLPSTSQREVDVMEFGLVSCVKV